MLIKFFKEWSFVFILLLLLKVPADASVIDFNDLTDPYLNGGVFNTYSEGEFTVTPSDVPNSYGVWFPAFAFGNPVPDIDCDGCIDGTVTITSNAKSFFTFASVDIGNASIAIAPDVDHVSIKGFRAGSIVFSQSGLQSVPGSFLTFTSSNPGLLLDSLTISATGTYDFNIDNIVLNATTSPAVREPQSFAMLGIGILSIVCVLKKLPRTGQHV